MHGMDIDMYACILFFRERGRRSSSLRILICHFYFLVFWSSRGVGGDCLGMAYDGGENIDILDLKFGVKLWRAGVDGGMDTEM